MVRHMYVYLTRRDVNGDTAVLCGVEVDALRGVRYAGDALRFFFTCKKLVDVDVSVSCTWCLVTEVCISPSEIC